MASCDLGGATLRFHKTGVRTAGARPQAGAWPRCSWRFRLRRLALAATTFKQPGFSQAVVFSGLDQPTAAALPARRPRDRRREERPHQALPQHLDRHLTRSPTCARRSTTSGTAACSAWPWTPTLRPTITSTSLYTLRRADRRHGAALGTRRRDLGSLPDAARCHDRRLRRQRAGFSRLTATGSDWTASEHVLIKDWCQQFPSHSVGALTFGADGYLYVSGGDGASFDNADWGQFGGTRASPATPKNPCGDPPGRVGGDQTPPTAEGGALRSQSPRRAAGEPRLLNGSILRVDPATGAGAAGQPLRRQLGSPTSSASSRYGFRNPFRITIRPGTERGLDRRRRLERLGGDRPHSGPDDGAATSAGPASRATAHGTTAAGSNICTDLYAAGTATPPFLTYNHAAHGRRGRRLPGRKLVDRGAGVLPGRQQLPGELPGRALLLRLLAPVHVGDVSRTRAATPIPSTVAPFASARRRAPVDLQIGPDGNLYYVDFDGGNDPAHRVRPARRRDAPSPTSGDPPLTVQFDGSGSTPAQPGDTLTYAWDLDGDGQFDDSTLPKPSFRNERRAPTSSG